MKDETATYEYPQAIELTDSDIDQVSGGWWGVAVTAGIAIIAGGWIFGQSLAQN